MRETLNAGINFRIYSPDYLVELKKVSENLHTKYYNMYMYTHTSYMRKILESMNYAYFPRYECLSDGKPHRNDRLYIRMKNSTRRLMLCFIAVQTTLITSSPLDPKVHSLYISNFHENKPFLRLPLFYCF